MKASPSKLVERVRAWPRRVLMTVLVVVAVLMAARIALPYVVKRLVNDRLDSVPGYTGRVNDIGISLLRGAYTIEGLAIHKVTGQVREPFVVAREIDFSIAWRDLIRGKIVSDIFVDRGELTFVAGPTEEASQKDLDRRWKEVAEDLFPLEITHMEVSDGMVRYQDDTRTPPVDLYIVNMHVLATGLQNRPDETGKEFPAEINVVGDTLGAGRLRLFIAANPLAPEPHFDLSVKLDGVNLVDLNDSLKAYANVDVRKGTFQMAAEMAGKDGGFRGYMKPFFENLDFNNLDEEDKGVFSRIWENVVQGLAWLVKNKPRDQVATRIPFQGRFGDPQVGLLATIGNLFRHGFIRAFNPIVEGSVSPADVLPSGESVEESPLAKNKSEPAKQQEKAEDAQRADVTNKPGQPTGRAR